MVKKSLWSGELTAAVAATQQQRQRISRGGEARVSRKCNQQKRIDNGAV